MLGEFLKYFIIFTRLEKSSIVVYGFISTFFSNPQGRIRDFMMVFLNFSVTGRKLTLRSRRGGSDDVFKVFIPRSLAFITHRLVLVRFVAVVVHGKEA